MDFSIGDYSFNADIPEEVVAAVGAELNAGANIGVGCSGGADSVLLLLLTLDIFRRHADGIFVLHFNHKARESADADESYVRGLCGRLGVRAFFGSPENPPAKKTESEFRKMRFKFFEDVCRREHISLILQGHHADDAAESAVMRLARGAGLDGLCAPKPLSSSGVLNFARPLLNMRKGEITAILKTAQVSWCEDETNFQNDHFRNKIRNIAIPEICAVAPDFARGVRRSQRLLCEDSAALEDAFDALFCECAAAAAFAGETMHLSQKIVAQRAFLRRALMKFLLVNSALGDVRSGGVDGFLNAVDASLQRGGNAPIKLSVGGRTVVFAPQSLSLSISEKAGVFAPFELRAGAGETPLPDGRVLRVRRITMGADAKARLLAGENDDSVRAVLDLSCVGGDIAEASLVVRSRRDGDSYAPIGLKTPKRLKELLNSKKVPLLKRKSAIVVCNAKGEILWVPPVAPADKFKIVDSSRALELTLK